MTDFIASPSQIQTPWCLTVCLPDSLDLDPMPIDFVLFKHLSISWFLRFHFCERCRNQEFTITHPFHQGTFPRISFPIEQFLLVLNVSKELMPISFMVPWLMIAVDYDDTKILNILFDLFTF